MVRPSSQREYRYFYPMLIIFKAEQYHACLKHSSLFKVTLRYKGNFLLRRLNLSLPLPCRSGRKKGGSVGTEKTFSVPFFDNFLYSVKSRKRARVDLLSLISFSSGLGNVVLPFLFPHLDQRPCISSIEIFNRKVGRPKKNKKRGKR